MDWKALFGFISLAGLLLTELSEESECSHRKMDLVIVIDGTSSIGYRRFDNIKIAVKNVLSKLDIGPTGANVGIIQFSDHWDTKIELNLGEHAGLDNVLSIVEKMRYTQGYFTLTGMALEMARKQFFGSKTKISKSRPGVDKVLLLITDGKPIDVNKLNKEVKTLKEKGVRIVTVAVGSSNRRIQRYKYLIRSIASGFKQSFNSEHRSLQSYVENIADEVCRKPRGASPSRETPHQKCFQEKKDIVFAVDGSNQVSEQTFYKAISIITKITISLDITPSLIHVSLVQYSNARNTRVEFGLNQYTNALHVNDSLKNVVYSGGREADLMGAIDIIDNEVLVGSGGDRLSADDYLLLFVNGKPKNSAGALLSIEKLKDKGVHVIVIGMGIEDVRDKDYYEKLASNPNDVSSIETPELKLILGDLAATSCRSVLCSANDIKGGKQCQQEKQDILFMVDTSASMTEYFSRAIKFFRKVVGKLNLAVTNTDVGLLAFGDKYNTEIVFELGKYKFEHDVTYRISRLKQRGRASKKSDIGYALKIVNKQIFNTSAGGHRANASDFIFMATVGNSVNRPEVKRQLRLLKAKGVRIAILNVDYKTPQRRSQNIIHEIASGPKEVYPLDFKRLSAITSDIPDVTCKVEESKASSKCFADKRKVMFMLDGSRMRSIEIPKLLEFIGKIVEKFYEVSSNIALGLVQYSDKGAKKELEVVSRTLQETLDAIKNIRFQHGRNNLLGDALEFVEKEKFAEDPDPSVKKVIILVTHNKLGDPRKAFKFAESLKNGGVDFITIAIHTHKRPSNINKQYKVLASSHASAQSFDYDKMLTHANDILLNVCELNACPSDFTKDCSPKKQDIFMIIDSSSSIGKRVYPELKRFVRRFVGNLDVSHSRTRVGILQASDSYATQYEMMLSEYTDRNDIQGVISEMNYHNGYASFIGDAIEKAIADNLFNGSGTDRPDAENVLMIFTDGVFQDERLAKRLISNLKQDGVRIISVGLGRRSRKSRAKKLLENVASSKSDVYLVSLRKDALLVENQLNEVVRHVQTLDCVNKYIAPVRCSPETVDLFVTVDGSRSVGWENYGKVKEFLKKLAGEFDIGKNKAHFGVLQFGAPEKTRVEFNLDTYDSNAKVNEAIENMIFLDSMKTYTGHALSVVNKQIFTGKNGDRPDVPNILIIFTDGSAHDLRTAYKNADELKERGTRIVGIGAGRKVNSFYPQLKKIVSQPKDAHKADFNELSGVVDDLLDVVCT